MWFEFLSSRGNRFIFFSVSFKFTDVPPSPSDLLCVSVHFICSTNQVIIQQDGKRAHPVGRGIEFCSTRRLNPTSSIRTNKTQESSEQQTPQAVSISHVTPSGGAPRCLERRITTSLRQIPPPSEDNEIQSERGGAADTLRL